MYAPVAVTRTTRAPIVVGVDGSRSSLDAVRAAVYLAAERRRPLRVVHAFIWPLLHVPLGPSESGLLAGGLRHDAERIVNESVKHAESFDAGVEISGTLVTGAAAPVLIAQARDAVVIVLGDRGLGGFTGLLVGSVAVQVAAHASCPVLIVRGANHPQGPIVVGVDGSANSESAVGFAFEEAALRGAELHAVHAWTGPVASGPGDMLPLVYDVDEIEGEETRVLAESVAGWRDRYPEVPLRQTVTRCRASQVLVESSTDAQLVIVGTRGRGGFTGLLLGSVSQALLHHAHCPLAIVR